MDRNLITSPDITAENSAIGFAWKHLKLHFHTSHVQLLKPEHTHILIIRLQWQPSRYFPQQKTEFVEPKYESVHATRRSCRITALEQLLVCAFGVIFSADLETSFGLIDIASLPRKILTWVIAMFTARSCWQRAFCLHWPCLLQLSSCHRSVPSEIHPSVSLWTSIQSFSPVTPHGTPFGQPNLTSPMHLQRIQAAPRAWQWHGEHWQVTERWRSPPPNPWYSELKVLNFIFTTFKSPLPRCLLFAPD